MKGDNHEEIRRSRIHLSYCGDNYDYQPILKRKMRMNSIIYNIESNSVLIDVTSIRRRKQLKGEE